MSWIRLDCVPQRRRVIGDGTLNEPQVVRRVGERRFPHADGGLAGCHIGGGRGEQHPPCASLVCVSMEQWPMLRHRRERTRAAAIRDRNWAKPGDFGNPLLSQVFVKF